MQADSSVTLSNRIASRDARRMRMRVRVRVSGSEMMRTSDTGRELHIYIYICIYIHMHGPYRGARTMCVSLKIRGERDVGPAYVGTLDGEWQCHSDIPEGYRHCVSMTIIRNLVSKRLFSLSIRDFVFDIFEINFESRCACRPII